MFTKMSTLILAILLLSGCNKLNVNPYELIKFEGFAAYVINQHKKTDPQLTTVDKSVGCKCNGTKKVKSGDGLASINCQCGADCKCKKDEGTGSIGSLPLPVKYIVWVTSETGCVACNRVSKVISRNNWIVVDNPTESSGWHILRHSMPNLNSPGDLIEKFPNAQGGVPYFQLVVDNVIVKEFNGFMDDNALLGFWQYPTK